MVCPLLVVYEITSLRRQTQKDLNVYAFTLGIFYINHKRHNLTNFFSFSEKSIDWWTGWIHLDIYESTEDSVKISIMEIGTGNRSSTNTYKLLSYENTEILECKLVTMS